MQKKNWPLLVLTSLAYIAFGLVTAVIGVIISRFQETYRVPLWIAGLLPFAFYLAYGLCSIPFGLAMDRLGGRLVIMIGMLMMTAGCFLFYFSSDWFLTVLMVFVIGVGVTAIQTAGNPVIRELDHPRKYASNLTIIIGISAFGYALSPVMVPYMEAKGYGWQLVYLIFGILNAVLFLMLLIVRFPRGSIAENEQVNLKVIFQLLKNPIIVTYSMGIFLYVAGEVGVSSYIVTFMEKQHGVGLQESLFPEGTFLQSSFPSVSAFIVALFWALQAMGRIVIGPLMNRIRPKNVFVICSGLCCLSLVASIFGGKSLALVSFALVGLFTCASFTAIFSAAIQSFTKFHGTISGILCTAIVGGAVGGILVGAVGHVLDLRFGMAVNLLMFLYVFWLAIFGKGK